MRSIPTVVWLVLFSACGLGAPEREPRVAAPETRRTTSLGDVVGALGSEGTHAWYGIPFAKPPTGDRRWRAPEAAAPWGDLREALADPAACPQPAPALGDGDNPDGTRGNEDCLYLNVFAPAFEAEAVPGDADLRPVMVWIHGGGNSIGDSGLYDGGHLAAAHGVVVVVVQYRLGPLGWLRHASLRSGADALDASGNYGTLDLIESRWVRANIAAFGGDPERVTVFGESAGGRNTFTMLQSPLAKGLFQRAIVQSGGLSAPTLAEAENLTTDREPGHLNSGSELLLRLLAAHGGAIDREAARAKAASLGDAGVASFLRERTPGELLAAYEGSSGMGLLRFPQIFPDGTVMPTESADSYGSAEKQFAAGRYNQVPVITGTNRDESKLFMAFDPEYSRLWFRILPSLRDPVRYERDAEYQSLAWKLNGTDDPARWMRKVQGPEVFAYRFDWDEADSFLWVDWSEVFGAAHAFEIPFVFGDFEIRPLSSLYADESLESREKLSRAMMSYWAEFAATGAPGRGRGGDLPEWKSWDESTPASDRFMILDTEADGGIRMSSDAVTSEALVTRMIEDDRFASSEERCAFLVELRGWRRALPDSELERAGCDPEVAPSTRG
jgi:para-nitrobenzyl esterase